MDCISRAVAGLDKRCARIAAQAEYAAAGNADRAAAESVRVGAGQRASADGGVAAVGVRAGENPCACAGLRHIGGIAATAVGDSAAEEGGAGGGALQGESLRAGARVGDVACEHELAGCAGLVDPDPAGVSTAEIDVFIRGFSCARVFEYIDCCAVGGTNRDSAVSAKGAVAAGHPKRCRAQCGSGACGIGRDRHRSAEGIVRITQ